ncbi:MAG TPA: N-terminal phage integrase SAM-like domain-containing protein [Propionibacteriaceae bacterium]|nr:N-terminal phage integrase SAM-like domain-containing protein [Propionibacteriaceae bacterium]
MAEPEKRIRGGRERWYARYYDPSGRRHSKAFDTKGEADRFLTTVKMSRITGSYGDPNRSRVILGSWADNWLAAKAHLSPTTRNRYEGIIATHVRPRWGRVKLSDVTHAEVQRSITGLRLSPGSVRKVHRVLSMVLTR